MKNIKFICVVVVLICAVLPLCARQVVQCGETGITVVSRHFWNLNSLDFAGKNLCRPQSYFGNVARYNCGWVGTGHKENKIGEKEVKVSFFADGKEFSPSRKVVNAGKFEMKKSSILLDMQIDYTLTLVDGKLSERAKVTVLRDTDVKILYLFMHPWCALFTDAEVTGVDGKVQKFTFDRNNKKKNFVKSNISKVVYTAPVEKIKAVSEIKVIKASPECRTQFLFWDRGVDRKLYFRPIHRKQLKKGTVFEYELNVNIERF